ncbi:hypothetical protein [Gemmata sp.]|uniref:hypothetical protein n=1 Tax=Gemmata sp. TaxID=1914242 RepID=UPI003F7155E2
MIRQFALSALLATGAFAGTASAAPPVVYGPAVSYGPAVPYRPVGPIAPRGPFVPPPRFVPHDHHYDVFVRRWLGWELQGSYDSRWEAERVANRLRAHGQWVRVTLH